MTDTSLSDPSQHLFWLASRALGVVAILLLSASVACGLALSGRMSDRPGGAAWLKTLHEALTLTALGAIAGHGLALLGDGYLSPGLSGIAVPFVMGFKQLWTGLGVIGGWMAAILGLSYYARRWIGAARWRKLHRWTLLAWVLAVAHTIGSGTDARSGWLLLMLAAVGLPAVGFALKRAADRPRERPLGGGVGTGPPAGRLSSTTGPVVEGASGSRGPNLHVTRRHSTALHAPTTRGDTTRTSPRSNGLRRARQLERDLRPRRLPGP